MAIDKHFTFKGLNLRDSEINKSVDYASDLKNVELNSRRELIKRFGYDEELEDADIIDVIEYVAGSKLLFIKSDGIYEDIAGTLTKIPFAGDGTTFTGLVDYDEYNNVVYITDTTGNNYLYKYDGTEVTRASLPAPVVNSVTASGSGFSTDFYYRVVFTYFDGKKNLIMGDYFQTEKISLASNPVINIDTLKNTEFSYLNDPTGQEVIRVLVFYSQNLTYGYTAIGSGVAGDPPIYFPVDHRVLTTWNIDVAAEGGVFSLDNPPMEDIYDTTVIKGLPPKARYVTVYGETLVLANVNPPATLDEALSYSTKSTFYWSDTGVGSTVETFPPFNKQQAGKTIEGEISGLFAGSDELVVMKTKQVYYVNGILIERSFRLNSSLSAGVGCVSHKSIVEAPSGCLFQSSRGIYFAGSGQLPIEISDIIEPLFSEDSTGLDLTLCRSVRDTKNEKVLFYIPATLDEDSIVLVYDYYYKEWFLYKDINAEKGLLIISDDLYHCDGTKLFKRSTGFSDDGNAIDAYYKTAFNHMGNPGLLKKFMRVMIHSVGAVSWVCNLISRKNYSSVDDTNVSATFSPSIYLQDNALNLSNCFSISFTFQNNVVDEGMLVTGYEVEVEQNQKTMKGND